MQDLVQESGKKELHIISASTNAEEEVARLAWYFFKATTRLSSDNEDILPQEDSEDIKLSVFTTFADLFPEVVGDNGAGAKNKRMRLHFNKVGYQIYGKEQSRRVPAVRAKPGNPGYGFRRARWRDTELDRDDRANCQKILKEAGCNTDKINQVCLKVQEVCRLWDSVRRPSRPAGPGRPRRPEDIGVAVSPVKVDLLGHLVKHSKEGDEVVPHLVKDEALSETELIMEGVSGSMQVKLAHEEGLHDRAPSMHNGILGKRRGEMSGELEKKGKSITPDVIKDGAHESSQCSKAADSSKELQPLLLPPLRFVEGNHSSSPASPRTLPSLSSFSRLEKLASAASRMQQNDVHSLSCPRSTIEKENS
mmetsp:Transcript_52722/g.163602  ORF Transcript_52722/g.163602 Transcript_52722/m.163602 type:complete len:364 (-) Transcript_52722:224-1315(-)